MADASAPLDAAVLRDPLCEESDLALCVTFDGTVVDQSDAMATIDVTGAPRFESGRRGMAMRGALGTAATVTPLFTTPPAEQTIEMWLRLNGLGGTILAERRFTLSVVADELALVSRFDGSFLRFGPYPRGRFFHIVYRLRPGNVDLFIDGVMVETTLITFDDGGATSLSITSEVDQLPFLQGAIDDLRVWSRQLTNAEIASNAASLPRRRNSKRLEILDQICALSS